VILGTGALGAAALDGAAIRRSLETLGLSEVLAVVSEDATPRDLAGLRAEAVRGPVDQLDALLAVARTTRAPRLILELPSDLDLEDACRGLFGVARRTPALELAVITPHAGPLAAPEPLGLLFEDLTSQRIRYWHRPAAAALIGTPDGTPDGTPPDGTPDGTPGDEWLNALDRHLVGMSLDDVAGTEAGLPPGTGEIDFGALASWTGGKLDLALDVDSVPDVGLLSMALALLSSVGLS
jgi:hypothetical protein